MKKHFITFLLLLFPLLGIGQTNITTTPANYDYSRFASNCKAFTTMLEEVKVTDDYTFVTLNILAHKNCAISFPPSIYIEGNGFRKQAMAIFDHSDSHELEFNRSYPLIKKQRVGVVIVFNAIPAGVEELSYVEPAFIYFENIPIHNPDTSIHTDWDEQSLRSYWQKNGISDNEGIYEFFECNNMEWWGSNKFTVAVKKEGTDYQIIYLRGTQDNPFWKVGDVKAIMRPTAVPNLFKASWFMDSKRPNDNFYITFDAATMDIKEKDQNVEATFLKMFPSAERYGTATQRNRENPTDNADAAYSSSGSGIIISTDGVVVTNYHVIEGAKYYDVVIKDNRRVQTYKAKILATDKTNDLALLMIDDDKFIPFDNIPFALKSTTSEVGTSVFAMGYPLTSYMGEEVKITEGIISSKTGYEGDIVTYQISAPIQPGNSGGPLFDKKGNLIAITNAGIMEANNVGYAIKASYLQNLIESAPISIKIPDTNLLQELELPEQIKQLSKYVTYIKVR